MARSTYNPADRPARTPGGNGYADARGYGRVLRSGDVNDPDPYDQIDGIAPNLGEDVLPHVVTFQGLLRNVARTYYVSDEALQHSWENARFMRNDPGIMECLEQRKRSTALLGWHLEADDEDDPVQNFLVDNLTPIVQQIPNFLKYRECLLDALWYGKYGCSHRFRWKPVNGRMRVVVDRWRPVNGDKIVFRYDDGSHEYDDDQVGIRVGAGYTAGSSVANRWNVDRVNKIAATDHGLAYFLEHWERPLIAIHKHMVEDAEYENPQRAGAIHGVGIRNRLYWLWYQKQETLAWLMEYLERSAFGIEIWSYPHGNDAAFEATKKAAQERIGEGRNIVLVPRHPDSDVLSSDLKRIEPGMAGADILDRIIREYFGWQIKRYILGQILTSETASTGLGSGVATIHLDTYLQIVRYDAVNLAESITTDLLQPLIRYNWPKYRDVPVKFVIETEAPDIEGKLSAWQKAYEMGLAIPAGDVYDLIGAAVPAEGDDVLRDPQHIQAENEQQQLAQQQQAQQAQQRAGGMGRNQAFGPDGQPLRVTSETEDVQKLFAMLQKSPEQYGKLRPGMERTIYHPDGTKTVERYRATPGQASDKGDKPGPEWRTIGGGSRVLIGDDGTIMAGCPGLETEDVDEIGEGEDPENRRQRDHRKAVAKAKGLEGDELTPAETKQLEQEPTPAGQPQSRKVRFGSRDYEVKSESGVWFFRVNEAAGWTMASDETAAAIEEQLGLNDVPFDVPAAGSDGASASDTSPVAEPPMEPSTEPPAESAVDQTAPEAQQHAQTKINPRTRVGKAILSTAAEYEIPPDDMADALEYVYELHTATDTNEVQRAMEAAHKLTGLYQSDVKWLKNHGFDHTSAKRAPARYAGKLAHFDAFAQEMARDYPALGLGDADDPNADFAAGLWEILDQDRAKVAPMDDPALLQQAAEMVLANRQYDPANVMAGSYEEFQKRGEVERYRGWKIDRQIERDVEQYAKSSKNHSKTVAVDLDGTLATYEGWQGEEHFGRLRPGARETLQRLRDQGYQIIIWTTRGNVKLVAEWLDSHDLPYDHINENPDQPEGSSEKVIADLYIDDRAVDGRQSWKQIQEELDQYAKTAPDRLPGGRADSRPDSDFPPDALAAGIAVESEHVDDPAIAREIAKDHLAEDPDYYEKLAFMESGQEVPVSTPEADDKDTDGVDDDAGYSDPDDFHRDLAERIAKAEKKTARRPSDAQKEAGNYRKGKCRLHGMEVSIENPAGSTRSGRNSHTGESWSVKLPYAYGYIRRTESEADGDHVDVFLGPDPDSEIVFVVDQTKPGTWTQFDEHKCMLGWKSAAEAKQAYLDSYSEDWGGFEAITPMTMGQFKAWLEKGDTGSRVAGQSVAKYAKGHGQWNESDHPRGQPENAGEFAKGEGLNRKQRIEARVKEIEHSSVEDLKAMAQTATGVDREAIAAIFKTHGLSSRGETSSEKIHNEISAANEYDAKEEANQKRTDEQFTEAHSYLTNSGWVLENQSESGSRYYTRGNERLRIADHYVPETDQRREGKFSWATTGNQIVLPVADLHSALSNFSGESP